MKKTFFALVLVSLILPPALAAAQDNGGVTNIWRNTSGGGCNLRGNACNLCDMIVVATNITKFLLVIAIAVAVVIILYGAVRMMVSGGSKDQLGIAKGILTKAIIGLVLVAGAWFIVDTIFQAFAKEEFKRWDIVDLSGWCSDGGSKINKNDLEIEKINLKDNDPDQSAGDEIIECSDKGGLGNITRKFTLASILGNAEQLAAGSVCVKRKKSCTTPDISDKTAFGHCNPDNFAGTCFDSVRNDAAVMCYIETAGGKSWNIMSGSDVCSDGTSFSGGMAQINILYHENSLPSVCRGLFWKDPETKSHGDCLKRNSGGACVRYNCGLNEGKEGDYQKCLDLVLDPSYQIRFACDLYTNRSPNNCWRDWPYTYKHCSDKVKSQEC